MSIPNQKFRELVFQMLYSYTQGLSQEEELLALLAKELCVTKKTVKEAQMRVQQILEKLSTIDELISKTSLSYAFERIQTVEKNILRLGMFELFYDSTIPKKVAIAEAKRLATKFSTPESASFVHAVLDAAYQNFLGQSVDQQELIDSTEKLEKMEKMTEELRQEEEPNE